MYVAVSQVARSNHEQRNLGAPVRAPPTRIAPLPLHKRGRDMLLLLGNGVAPSRCSIPIMSGSSSPQRVVALDLDGVICDSEPELTTRAWRATCELWPDVMGATAELGPKTAGARRAWAKGNWSPLEGVSAEGLPNWLAAKMRILRPVLETGYDSMLMMRLCADEALAAGPGKRPLTPGEIQANWGPELRDTLSVRYGLQAEEAIERYSTALDTWRADDPNGWLSANRFYEGAVDALRAAVADNSAAVHVLTAQETHVAQGLLRIAELPIEEDRVISLHGGGEKALVLAELRQRHPDAQLAYVEDRVPVLRTMANEVSLFACELYFAQWGHSTPEQQAAAASMPRVRALGPDSSELARALRGVEN